MIATRQECLTAHELKDLLAGRLPTERFAQALAHVDTCEKCSQVATESGPSDCEILKRSADDVLINRFQQESECQAVMGQLLLQPNARFRSCDNGELPIEHLGPYRLLKWLGSGGMGAVYLAEHQRLKRLSAIKLLSRDKLQQTDWLERFNREMTSIAALEHMHVVRAMDAGDQDGWHYLVMEYLDGADLGQVCRCFGQLPIGTACELIRQASLGLAAIHELGMTHRDIKPSNIFLTRQGVIKLLDLGLVLSGDSPLATDERLTTVGHLMGTLPYMAREQLLDASEVDWRADIYSLGATLFRMLTGYAPLGSSQNLALAIQAITTSDCPKIESLMPDVPRELAELIDNMLSHDRNQRPQSASRVAEELTRFSDAQGPRSLIRTTLVQLESSGVSNSAPTLNGLSQSPLRPAGHSAKPPSRVPLWAAVALLPIAFLAGIVISVLTDRGTLVIESAESGVTVKVTQGDRVVDSLKVENQPGVLRLHSGKYIVELDGASGDALELSSSQVIVTRGQKEVVRITKKSAESAEQPHTGNSYQGKSFAFWMDILQREKDVAMIAQAIEGVALLADNESDRLAAARQILLPARRLGGHVMKGRPRDYYAPDPSGWYMTELSDRYASLLPQPGLDAITSELDAGNERSSVACLTLLSMYGHRVFNTNMGPSVDVKLSEYLGSLAGTEEGRAKLRRLVQGLIKANEKLQGESFGAPLAMRQAITISSMLNDDLSQRPEFVAWAESALKDAEVALTKPVPDSSGKEASVKRSPLDALTALYVSETLKHVSSQSLLLGLLESPYPPSADFEKQLTLALERVATLNPRDLAAAIELHFERIKAFNEGIVQDRFRPVFATADRVRIATRTLLAHVQDRKKLVDILRTSKVWGSPQSIFTSDDVIELIMQLEAH